MRNCPENSARRSDALHLPTSSRCSNPSCARARTRSTMAVEREICKRMHRSICISRLMAAGFFALFAPRISAEHFNIQVHDPVMIKQDGTYYIFCTGRGVSVFSSKDMKAWQAEKPVF